MRQSAAMLPTFETVTSDRLITLLERLCDEHARQDREGTPFLAFDADGTLWRGDIGCDVFEAQIKAGYFTESVRPLFEREMIALGLAPEADLTQMARVLLAEFYAGRYGDGPSSEMMAMAFAGRTPEEMAAFVRDAVGAVGIEGRVLPAVRAIIRWAQEIDLPVYVVSASLAVAVAAAVSVYEIAPERVIAMVPQRAHGRCVLELDGGSVYGTGKVDAIERTVQGGALIAAFGDSAGDVFMMRTASLGVGVGPSERLLNAATSVPAFVILDQG
jgi:phosphatidylglycerophosphatase C